MIIKLKRDYKGQLLCEPCWNSQHYGNAMSATGRETSRKFSRCLSGGCECHCREVLEQRQRRKAVTA